MHVTQRSVVTSSSIMHRLVDVYGYATGHPVWLYLPYEAAYLCDASASS